MDGDEELGPACSASAIRASSETGRASARVRKGRAPRARRRVAASRATASVTESSTRPVGPVVPPGGCPGSRATTSPVSPFAATGTGRSSSRARPCRHDERQPSTGASSATSMITGPFFDSLTVTLRARPRDSGMSRVTALPAPKRVQRRCVPTSSTVVGRGSATVTSRTDCVADSRRRGSVTIGSERRGGASSTSSRGIHTATSFARRTRSAADVSASARSRIPCARGSAKSPPRSPPRVSRAGLPGRVGRVAGRAAHTHPSRNRPENRRGVRSLPTQGERDRAVQHRPSLARLQFELRLLAGRHRQKGSKSAVWRDSNPLPVDPKLRRAAAHASPHRDRIHYPHGHGRGVANLERERTVGEGDHLVLGTSGH